MPLCWSSRGRCPGSGRGFAVAYSSRKLVPGFGPPNLFRGTARLCVECVRSGMARIAVAGLNPHAGENGLFGDEELREIIPAVEWARQQGMPVEGPYPPDTVFYAAVRKKQFDAVVCMYHDQGHIPLKLLDFEGGAQHFPD